MSQYPVVDQLQRPVKDLRISLTDRCQFRCHYCLPAEHVAVMRQQSQPEKHLNDEQITAVVAAFAQLGVSKIRLTGGEPLLRKNVPALVHRIKQVKGIEEVALTTNAGLLDPVLDDLVTAGLDRITVSLDALDPELFAAITGTQYPVTQVLNAIQRCVDSGLKQVKVNCVIQKNTNEHQIVPMLAHFRDTGVVVRFIEYMDVGTINQWQPDQVLSSQHMQQMVAAHWPFESLPPQVKGEVANRFRFNDGGGEFGLISSISQPFCHDCNRARLSTQGEIYTCLFAHQGHDIKAVIEQPDLLLQRLTEIWQQRQDQYSAQRSQQRPSNKGKIEMFMIGG
ncbi:GTP 3',8-cyclase MoaA [Marinicella meishanensis]|uniref:GTP 3',8-cyclase MoaA n=1 Tax=Marinicella meishanensis TaxID=2873263 RepID=UPI001CBC88C4|nr:GTP 3',8-cyclase MoaA [Marinicella sp. NBU2979]